MFRFTKYKFIYKQENLKSYSRNVTLGLFPATNISIKFAQVVEATSQTSTDRNEFILN